MRRWLSKAWDFLTLMDPQEWRAVRARGRRAYLRMQTILVGAGTGIIVAFSNHFLVDGRTVRELATPSFAWRLLGMATYMATLFYALAVVTWRRSERRYNHGSGRGQPSN